MEDEAADRECKCVRPYMFALDDWGELYANRHDCPSAIDAEKRGNASRFLNHSCSPNLKVLKEADFVKYCVANYGVQRLVFVAIRDISKGDQRDTTLLCLTLFVVIR